MIVVTLLAFGMAAMLTGLVAEWKYQDSDMAGLLYGAANGFYISAALSLIV